MAEAEKMESSDEKTWAAKWREDERKKETIADDMVWEDGRISRASQTYESNFPGATKEKPVAVVLPNAHLKDAVAWRQPPGNRGGSEWWD